MITLILPTYNEKDNIELLVKKILNLKISNLNLMIVDDNSPDGTGKIADMLARKYRKVAVQHRSVKKGLGSAIKYGFERVSSDVFGVMDTDLSHDPKALKQVFREFNRGADFVIGSRYVRGGGIEKWPFTRLIVSKIATWLVKPLTNAKDPMSGFFFIRKNVIKKSDINPESCKICLDILVRGKYNKLVEVPYIFADRKKGSTKIFTPKEILKYFKHIIYLYSYKMFGRG